MERKAAYGWMTWIDCVFVRVWGESVQVLIRMMWQVQTRETPRRWANCRDGCGRHHKWEQFTKVGMRDWGRRVKGADEGVGKCDPLAGTAMSEKIMDRH